MKGAIFNFLVLQIVVWAFVFSTNEKNSTDELRYASISDTWSVNEMVEENTSEVILHYPSFNQLTLNQDGTYSRKINNAISEVGNWNVDEDASRLTLMNSKEIKHYDIIQFPYKSSESFIIKERVTKFDTAGIIKYELTRI